MRYCSAPCSFCLHRRQVSPCNLKSKNWGLLTNSHTAADAPAVIDPAQAPSTRPTSTTNDACVQTSATILSKWSCMYVASSYNTNSFRRAFERAYLFFQGALLHALHHVLRELRLAHGIAHLFATLLPFVVHTGIRILLRSFIHARFWQQCGARRVTQAQWVTTVQLTVCGSVLGIQLMCVVGHTAFGLVHRFAAAGTERTQKLHFLSNLAQALPKAGMLLRISSVRVRQTTLFLCCHKVADSSNPHIRRAQLEKAVPLRCVYDECQGGDKVSTTRVPRVYWRVFLRSSRTAAMKWAWRGGQESKRMRQPTNQQRWELRATHTTPHTLCAALSTDDKIMNHRSASLRCTQNNAKRGAATPLPSPPTAQHTDRQEESASGCQHTICTYTLHCTLANTSGKAFCIVFYIKHSLYRSIKQLSTIVDQASIYIKCLCDNFIPIWLQCPPTTIVMRTATCLRKSAAQ